MSDHAFRMDSIASQWSVSVERQGHFLVSRQPDGSLKEWKVLPPLRYITPLPERPKIIKFGAIELRQYRRRLLFFKGDQLLWDIDTGRFAGTPTLAVSNDGKAIRLENACFPGTLIPADLSLTISEEAGRWQMRLGFKWGGFQADVDLERWLNYGEKASSNLLQVGAVCNVGLDGQLSIADVYQAYFYPSWTFAISGQVTFEGLGTHLEHNLLTINLLPPEVLSFDKGNDSHLTLLSLGHGKGVPWFNLALQGEGQAAWRTREGSPVYSALQITAWEPVPAGQNPIEPIFFGMNRIIAAISQYEPAPRLEMELGGGLLGKNAAPLAIPLFRPGYFAVYQRDGAVLEQALIATLSTEAQWLHSQYVSLRLGVPQHPLLLLNWGMGRTRCGHPNLLPNKEYGLRYVLEESMVRADGLTAEPVGYPADASAIVALGSDEPRLAEYGVVLVRLTGTEPAKIIFPADWQAKFQRHQDLLLLQFRFNHIRLTAQGSAVPRLERMALLGEKSTITVYFQTQSIAEACSHEAEDGTISNDQPLPFKSVCAEPSRLAWQLIRNGNFDAKLLLGWVTDPSIHGLSIINLSPSLAASAFTPETPRPPASIQPPAADETAIEAPVRLFLSPDQNGVWEGSRIPVGHSNHTELWHVRLRDKQGRTPNVRAIWAKDYAQESSELPLPTYALNQKHRQDIVNSSINEKPVNSYNLMLSSMGAWLDLKGAWKEGSLELWRHIATLGRDHFVRAVYKGYLFPFGHRAVYEEITERKFINRPPMGYREARLVKRYFITVREKERVFPLPADNAGAGLAEQLRRCFPFERVEILTQVTSLLDNPNPVPPSEDDPDYMGGSKKAFWPKVNKRDYKFNLRAVDRDGNSVEFMAPLAFVVEQVDAATFDKLIAQKSKSTYDFMNQLLAFVPNNAERKQSVACEVNSITLAAIRSNVLKITGDADAKRPLNPSMAYVDGSGKLAFTPASVVLPVLRQLGGAGEAKLFTYAQAYADAGFGGNNKGELFFKADATFDLAFGKDNKPDKIGALATPNIKVGGISRWIGAFGINESHPTDPLEDIKKGSFNPASYFSNALQAKLLGGIRLNGILSVTDFAAAPQWVTKQDGQDTIYSLQWKTAPPFLIANDIFIPGNDCRLNLMVENRVKSDGKNSSQMTAELQNFAISLAKVLTIKFRKFSYKVVPGSKPIIHLELDGDGMEFAKDGALAFISAIQDKLGLAHFSDPPYVRVDSNGITAGYSLPIPSIAIGAFALQNLALSAGITLPFTGDPMRARFALSERHAPFMVTVSLFAGEGFVALTVGPDGVDILEVSLGFGASIQLNLGVASGGVSVMGGIYIKYGFAEGADTKSAVLSGYVRISGAMEVLGLICISVNYELSLSYETSSKVAWGEVSASIKVEVAFFSKSVTLHIRRELAGGSKDLSFAEVMPPQDWDSYQTAFAKEL
ncbi:MAG: hypothetical protein QJT81_00070 [Candidatus Thiothrix putei]|uniref:Uncharacterized protein n=1 Tax=Candidatus Thiothrix putei TaxID=3080811 RepID=A0AA95HDS3_9GAMM|nr:MAG: hypothetical protein QJT81_00070 [Candidatus Thiothrix putei]